MISAGLFAAAELLLKVEKVFSLLPPYRQARALVLDTVLGPAENLEYVGTDHPTWPPTSS